MIPVTCYWQHSCRTEHSQVLCYLQLCLEKWFIGMMKNNNKIANYGWIFIMDRRWRQTLLYRGRMEHSGRIKEKETLYDLLINLSVQQISWKVQELYKHVSNWFWVCLINLIRPKGSKEYTFIWGKLCDHQRLVVMPNFLVIPIL